MESVQNAKEKLKKIRQSQKVLGVPKLPRKIDAMYDNVCRGHFTVAYLDGDPVRNDPVYIKLEGMYSKTRSFDESKGFERVARYFRGDMQARQMKEETYNHIKDTPVWLLMEEFSLLHATDIDLRRKMKEREEYMYRCEEKKWID